MSGNGQRFRLQMAPFRGMKEEELVAFLFGLPNSLKHFEPGDIIARQGDLCKGLYILASGSVRAGMINDEGKELTVTNPLRALGCTENIFF